MKELMEKAKKILLEWKGDNYAFGDGALNKVGIFAKSLGKKALIVVADMGQTWVEPIRQEVEKSLKDNDIEYQTILGAAPNAPREDVYRIAMQLCRSKADMILAIGGGSTIDACKAAAVLVTYAPEEVAKVLGVNEALAGTIDPYFGVGNVTKIKEATGLPVLPNIAVQTAASSAAHLTKGSNITDPVINQKKLIVDEAIYPAAAAFDYSVTLNAPKSLTVDGGLDGIAHVWEVLTGAVGYPQYHKLKEATEISMRLIIFGLKRINQNPSDQEARMALGLGTDVAGFVLMHGPGGTHGPHLGSFSLVDIMSHGRACALLNPYYTVLFSKATQDALKMAASVFKDAGYIKKELDKLSGRDLGMAVAEAMISFWKELGFPTSLKEAGATENHLERMLMAARNPQLRMKLQQMPIPMDAEKGDVDKLMNPTLKAAFLGDLNLVPTI
ncbi:MAG: iron-containing alcohol dehydrogenase [Thermodesulfobacteriota bacterium]